ncbi:MAG TPA: magnesium transporter CorA family protein [Paracoccaceae bacterium]|nr:magnesium transporter CorA family protein [Paracoccaceae bacterium]
MLMAYRKDAAGLAGLGGADLSLAGADWIDLCQPTPEEAAAVQALGVDVPTLEDMEEIEISSRLYRENGTDYITVVLPGHTEAGEHISAPVCFVLTSRRIVTVRHHTPRPFKTYPTRADKVAPGCDTPDKIFLSLLEEITGRLADHLEGSGRMLDGLARNAYGEGRRSGVDELREALRLVGHEGEMIARVRLALLTLERALSFFGQTVNDRIAGEGLRPVVKGLARDIQALEVHADFLSARVAQGTDATLGMINLDQNQTIKIVSVVAAVFLPPTLIASVYGMNFAVMPELGWRWGYPLALGLMLASAVGTFLFFKWKRWL